LPMNSTSAVMKHTKGTNHMSNKIFGHDWADIQRAQQGGSLHRPIKLTAGDYGADPIGDGAFRMVPSGDIVDLAECNRRLVKD